MTETATDAIRSFEVFVKVLADFAGVLPDKNLAASYLKRLANSGHERAIMNAKNAVAAQRSAEQRIAEIDRSRQQETAQAEARKKQALAEIDNQLLHALGDIDKRRDRASAELQERELDVQESLVKLSSVQAVLQQLDDEVTESVAVELRKPGKREALERIAAEP
jgi:hypothetical protein